MRTDVRCYDLRQPIVWRFVQGLVTPGIFSIAIAYIHEEWPAARAGGVTAAYVGGTVIGGFVGRGLMAVIASAWSSQRAFVLLSFIATFAIGFGILCTQVATFTSVTFYLSAPPFGLSTAALGWLFITYLVGAVLTPIAGRGTVATDDARRFSWRSPWGSAPCC